MTSDEKKNDFKKNDKWYIFYDKEDFYNSFKRFLFLSRSDSLDALSSYLDIPRKDIFEQIKNGTIPVDWMLRMGFRWYEMISVLTSNNGERPLNPQERFEERYKKFRLSLDVMDTKKLTESVEKAFLFHNPILVDEVTKKYLYNLANSLKKKEKKM